MDAVKIIKKHGEPGGLPVITAYVADNAPGESEIHINVVDPQSVETLENLQYQGQTYVVPETPWIPTPTVGNAGKVLGVSAEGSYELQTPSGGDYDFDIFYSYQNDSYNTTISNYTVTKALTRAQFIAKVTNKEAIRAKLIREYYNDSGDTAVTKQYLAILSWYSYEDTGTGYKLHFNEIKTTSLSQLTLTFNNDGVLTAAATS